MAKRQVLVEVEADLTKYNSDMSSGEKRLYSFVKQVDTMGKRAERSSISVDGLAGALGKLLVADRAIRFAESIGQGVIQLERMNIAMQNITGSYGNYIKSQQFILGLTDKYGQAIVETTRSYNQFIASSNSSNLSLEKRQEIFASIIKTGSSLQLSNESVERSFYAISQMFSKGTVQAEELRQQLGDHIPGAFSLMAQAIGVSESKLMSLMKNGLVPASEALPKFAALLEQTYGNTAARNIETLSGAWNRLNSQIIYSSNELNQSLGITKSIAGAINSITDNLGAYAKALGVIGATFAIYRSGTLAAAAANTVFSSSIASTTAAAGAATIGFRIGASATTTYTVATRAATIATTALSAAMRLLPWVAAATAAYLLVDAVSGYADRAKTAKDITQELDSVGRNASVTYDNMQVRIESLTKVIDDSTRSESERKQAISTLVSMFPEIFKGIDTHKLKEGELQKAIALTTEFIKEKIKFMELEAKMSKASSEISAKRGNIERMKKNPGDLRGVGWDDSVPLFSTDNVVRDIIDIFSPGTPGGLSYNSDIFKRALKAEQDELKIWEAKLDEFEKEAASFGKRWLDFISGKSFFPEGGGGEDDKGGGGASSSVDKQITRLSSDLSKSRTSMDKLIEDYEKQSSGLIRDAKSIEIKHYARMNELAERLNAIGQRDLSKFGFVEQKNILGGKTPLEWRSNMPSLTDKYAPGGANTMQGPQGNAGRRKSNAEIMEGMAADFRRDTGRIIADGLGEVWVAAWESVFSRDINFGTAMKKTFGDLLKTLGMYLVKSGAMYLIAGKSKTATESALSIFGGGPSSIAGAVAMMALGGAMAAGGSAMSSSAGKSASSGVSSSAGNGYRSGGGISYGSTAKMQVEVQGQFVVRGSDLVASIRNTNNRFGNV